MLPEIVFGDFALVIAVQNMNHPDSLDGNGRELADGNVYDGAAHARGDGFENRSRGLGGHVNHVMVNRIIDPRQE